jgi:ADP-ribose pyrophosphatase YjhB (NUDIX family)
MRETLEETGLVVEPMRIVGIYSRIQAAVVVVAYEARITGGRMTTTPESLEVRSWTPDAIPWPELAFNTTLWAIRDWVRSVRPDLDVAALGSEHPAR